MRPILRPRPSFMFALSMLLAMSGVRAHAATLELPVYRPDRPVAAPCYRGDALELQLTPSAARAILPRGAGVTRSRPSGRLGLASLDALATSVGAVAFEPEFRGEAPPEDGGPDFTAFHIVHLAPGTDLAAALDAFRASSDVRSAEPIALMPVSAALPADSLTFATWWLYKDQPTRTDIRAPEAWAVESGDTNIVVGILDTGVIPYHPDLGGRGIERGAMYINWAERAGLPGVDDDGNGFIDDFGGWDFVQSTVSAPPAAGEDGINEDNDPNDWGGHGTACAGIIGAIPGNGIGLAGVVPQVRMMPLRIGWLQSGGLPPAGTVDMSYAAAAIRYATRMGADVLNCSWQSQNLAGLDAAVSAATRAGVVIVNASGNFGTTFTYLGQRDDVIAVTATDSTDAVWVNAVKGPWVDLAAGGLTITSTMFQRLSQTDSLVGRTPAYKGFINGTSFAAPQVAGAVALLQAQRLHAGRDPLTPMGANLRVRETADDIAARNPAVTGYGTGRLNLFRALTDPTRSLAIRTRARSIGAPVVLRYDDGHAVVVTAMSDRTLLATNGATGDTLWTRTLPALPTGHLAAAQFALPAGPIVYCATASGTVFAFRDNGDPVPGWPVTAAAGVNLSGGVTLADLDGDGVAEVIASGGSVSLSRVWAWSFSGNALAGFPFDPGTLGLTACAAADLDGTPGDELAFLDGTGALRVIDHTGNELPGFPAAALTGARAPVIARLGHSGGPAVLVASQGALTAFAPDGSTRWSVALTGNPAQDPALADLDGDGADEVVLAMGGPNAIVALDSAGVAFTGRPGWPAALSAPPQGAPVVGPLGGGGRPGVAVFLSSGLVVLDDAGRPVPGFPKPGLAGIASTIDQLDADDASEIAAGVANPDSNAYTYDAGAGSWDPGALAWPSPRGGARRAASHAKGTPPPFVIDRTRPARITDLEARTVDHTTVRLTFTHVGDDSVTGTCARLVLRSFIGPLDDQNFNVGILQPPVPPRAAGTPDTLLLSSLPEGSTLWFAMRAIDDVGNPGAVSNSDSASLPGLAPGAITDLRVLEVAESLAVITWTATGDDGNVGRPRDYRIAASPEPLDDATFETAPIRFRRPALYDAGRGETLEVRRLTPGRRWRFALKAVDESFAESPLSNIAEAVTPVGGALGGRVGMALAPRPMPAFGDVTIDWQGDASGTVQHVLVVHDLNGRLIRRVVLGREPGGSYTWNGRDEHQKLVPAGLYFLRLESGSRHADSRVVFVR